MSPDTTSTAPEAPPDEAAAPPEETPSEDASARGPRQLRRLRIGIILFVCSWLPIAQLVIWLADPSDAQTVRLAIWGAQWLIGFVGVALVGSVAVKTARSAGWRKTPRALARLFVDGA